MRNGQCGPEKTVPAFYCRKKKKKNNLCASENAASPLVTYPSPLCSPDPPPAKCLSAGSKPCGNTPKGIKRAETCLSSSWPSDFPYCEYSCAFFQPKIDRCCWLLKRRVWRHLFLGSGWGGGQRTWAAAVKSTVWCTLGTQPLAPCLRCRWLWCTQYTRLWGSWPPAFLKKGDAEINFSL